MKSILTTFLFIIPFFAIAQLNSSVDLISSIDYTYRHLGTSNEEAQFRATIESRKKEKGNLNWRFGLNYNTRLSDRVFLKTGIRLASLGYHRTVDYSDLQWGVQFDPTTGTFDPGLPSGEIEFGDYKIIDNYWFVEVPLVIRYELSDKKITPYVEAGFGVAYYLLHRNVSNDDGEREVNISTVADDNNFVKKVSLEGIIAFGANYNLKENLQLFGQPTFRYHLTKLWDTDLEERLWALGLEVGVRREF